MIEGERLNRPLLQMLSPGLEKLEFFVTGQPKSLLLEVDGSFGPLVVKGSKSGLKMEKSFKSENNYNLGSSKLIVWKIQHLSVTLM